jgi:hypothetical protein
MLRNQRDSAKHIPPWRIGWQPELILTAELKEAARATRYGVVAPREESWLETRASVGIV